MKRLVSGFLSLMLALSSFVVVGAVSGCGGSDAGVSQLRQDVKANPPPPAMQKLKSRMKERQKERNTASDDSQSVN